MIAVPCFRFVRLLWTCRLAVEIINNNNNNLLHLYSAFQGTQSALVYKISISRNKYFFTHSAPPPCIQCSLA